MWRIPTIVSGLSLGLAADGLLWFDWPTRTLTGLLIGSLFAYMLAIGMYVDEKTKS